MKALVTGASGFIGSSLIRELASQGYGVQALMRRSSSPANLEGVRFERVEGDLEDSVSLKRAVAGADVVFHLAGAITAPTRQKYFEWNTEGTRRLAQAVAESGRSIRRFVFVSSLAAGGPSPGAAPRDESLVDQPVSTYGESKLKAEEALHEYRSSFPITIVRPPIVYGPRDRATFVFVQTVARGILPLFGNKVYSMIHVRDLVHGLIRAGQVGSDVASCEKFYLSGDRDCSYEEFMSAIASRLGKRPIKLRIPIGALAFAALALEGLGRVVRTSFPLNLDKMNELRPDYWTCSNAKAKRLLEFRPEVDPTSGWADAVDWYKANRWI